MKILYMYVYTLLDHSKYTYLPISHLKQTPLIVRNPQPRDTRDPNSNHKHARSIYRNRRAIFMSSNKLTAYTLVLFIAQAAMHEPVFGVVHLQECVRTNTKTTQNK